MVYAGYVPAKLPTIKSDLDLAVQAVTNLETLEIIGKLLYNAATQPKEDKYRRIRLTNDKIRTTITDVPGAVDLLLALGWVQEDDCLTIPAGVYMTMKEVRMIEEQKDRTRKEARSSQVEAIRKAGTSQQPQPTA